MARQRQRELRAFGDIDTDAAGAEPQLSDNRGRLPATVARAGSHKGPNDRSAQSIGRC
jgi:hypothetical protein